MQALSRHAAAAALLTLTLAPAAAAQIWVEEGPAPTTGGQVEGITDREVTGAIQTVAPHPSDADVLYIGAANGGIWRTGNATAASPTWTDQTGDRESLSIGAINFDPTDGSNLTLVAGVGLRSSYAGIGGRRTGLLHTVDGGATWTPIGGTIAGKNVIGIAGRGATLLAAVDIADSFLCTEIGLWRSTDSGASWTLISGLGGSGLPLGASDDLEADPSDPTRFYLPVQDFGVCSSGDGIYRSTDSGATWTKISDAAVDAPIGGASTTVNVKIAVSPVDPDSVFVGVVGVSGTLAGVFHTSDATAPAPTWTTMDVPGTTEGASFVGIHPGSQGSIHFALAADDTDADIVYVSGDRQPSPFPNSIGAVDFSGRLFRGDASAAPGSQWTTLTHSGTASSSSPHADSRDMEFDAAGNLIEGDDGGVYVRTSPRVGSGDWFSINGDLQVTELHDAAYDPVADIILGGAQDTGTPQQVTPGVGIWASLHNGDGGDVAIDSISVAGESTRYSSFQNLGAFRRRTYDASNALLSQVFPALTTVSGSPPSGFQFTTPVAVNNADGLRLVLGASNSVYESLDRGDTISEVGPGITVTDLGRNNIAYGAADNPDVLYVAEGSSVYVRTLPPPAPLALSAAYPGGFARTIVVDPDDSTRAFVVHDTGVLLTEDAGASWTDVSGNLPSFDPGTVRSAAYLSRTLGDAVVVGCDRGTYIAEAGSGFSTWSSFGVGMPDVPVYDLDYDADGDKLVAGTLGRGAFSVTGTFLTGTCVDDLNALADLIASLDLALFEGTTDSRRARRQRVLVSRARGAANAMAQCSESIAVARLESLLALIDGVGTDYMVPSPEKTALAAQVQDAIDTISAGECVDCP